MVLETSLLIWDIPKGKGGLLLWDKGSPIYVDELHNLHISLQVYNRGKAV